MSLKGVVIEGTGGSQVSHRHRQKSKMCSTYSWINFGESVMAGWTLCVGIDLSSARCTLLRLVGLRPMIALPSHAFPGFGRQLPSLVTRVGRVPRLQYTKHAKCHFVRVHTLWKTPSLSCKTGNLISACTAESCHGLKSFSCWTPLTLHYHNPKAHSRGAFQ